MKSPLRELHEKLGATFTNFSGYEMPLKYTSIQEEHLNVRRKVGIFDVSHMGNIFIRGKKAERLISRTTTSDVGKIGMGKGDYTVILRDDGTIIDDEVFLHLENEYLFIPNAGSNKDVEKWFRDHAEGMDVEIEDVSQDFVILAVQGPMSEDCLKEIIDFDLSTLGFFACKELKKEGNARCIVSRTGYTGEKGYEFYITPAEEGRKMFLDVMEAGKKYGIKPIGLGARDTLRLEKCFALAGNEFEGGRTPLEAGLGWLIHWNHDFVGKEMLLKQKEGEYEKLVFLECIDRGIPRHGYGVEKDGKEVGKVTSGTFSPCLKKGIAMAYIKPGYNDVEIFDIIFNGRKMKARRIKPPFVKKGEC
ncbi:MAG: glycine cleavage system aminomethyltransferase GcvT [Candidatus Thermoplasmatota archaeon]|nr:glycine cleavage system aminomethyltransferase GcvT [Candidatus Thermoplasmatota archaeon]